MAPCLCGDDGTTVDGALPAGGSTADPGVDTNGWDLTGARGCTRSGASDLRSEALGAIA